MLCSLHQLCEAKGASCATSAEHLALEDVASLFDIIKGNRERNMRVEGGREEKSCDPLSLCLRFGVAWRRRAGPVHLCVVDEYACTLNAGSARSSLQTEACVSALLGGSTRRIRSSRTCRRACGNPEETYGSETHTLPLLLTLQHTGRIVQIAFPDSSRRSQTSDTTWEVTTLPIDVRSFSLFSSDLAFQALEPKKPERTSFATRSSCGIASVPAALLAPGMTTMNSFVSLAATSASSARPQALVTASA